MANSGDRIFAYEGVKGKYNAMKTQTDLISQTLTETDNIFREYVAVQDKAIYGDLGDQILLDWENTSGCFPDFVSNFSLWSALIAQSSSDYGALEEEIRGFNEANPYGREGVTDSIIGSSAYTQYGVEYHDKLAEQYKGMFNVDPTEYENTNAIVAWQDKVFWIRVDEGLMIADLLLACASANASINGYGVQQPTQPQLPAPQQPQLPGGSQLALPGNSYGVSMVELGEKVALTNPGSQATTQLLGYLNQAESAGATFASFNTATGAVEFYNGSGAIVAQLVNNVFAFVL